MRQREISHYKYFFSAAFGRYLVPPRGCSFFNQKIMENICGCFFQKTETKLKHNLGMLYKNELTAQ